MIVRSQAQLGIAPLVAVAAGTTAVAAGAALTRFSDAYVLPYVTAAAQYVGLADTPQVVQSPRAILPPAPQTEAKLTTWTIDDLWEAGAQRQAQITLDMDHTRKLAAEADKTSPSTGSSGMWMLAAAGAGILALGLFLGRH